MSEISSIDFSHYRPTPDSRRFSISTFAITGELSYAAKPAGEFSARVDVVKGAFAKMIPFQAMDASVKIVDAGKKESGTKVFSQTIVGGKKDGEAKEKKWTDLSVISPIEIPWVAEYALQRWSVGGPQKMFFNFEDTQRVRTAILYFREKSDASGIGDAMAVLRVLKPDETGSSETSSKPNVSGGSVKSRGGPSSIAKTQKESRPGDVLVTFRSGKIAGFTISVPIVGKLQFVAV